MCFFGGVGEKQRKQELVDTRRTARTRGQTGLKQRGEKSATPPCVKAAQTENPPKKREEKVLCVGAASLSHGENVHS